MVAPITAGWGGLNWGAGNWANTPSLSGSATDSLILTDRASGPPGRASDSLTLTDYVYRVAPITAGWGGLNWGARNWANAPSPSGSAAGSLILTATAAYGHSYSFSPFAGYVLTSAFGRAIAQSAISVVTLQTTAALGRGIVFPAGIGGYSATPAYGHGFTATLLIGNTAGVVYIYESVGVTLQTVYGHWGRISQLANNDQCGVSYIYENVT
jgi:hypothetical protein